MTKFVISDSELLNSIPVQDRASEVELLKDLSEKALGINWNVEDDEFYFSVKLGQDCATGLTR